MPRDRNRLAQEVDQGTTGELAAGHPNCGGRRQVGVLVANQEAAVYVDGPVAQGRPQHAGLRLAAGASDGQGRHGPLGVVGTAIEGVHMGPKRLEVLLHPGMERRDGLFGVVAPGDPGLVGDHDHEPAQVVGQLDGLPGPVDPVEVLKAVDIPMIVIEDAVAVQKKRRPATLGDLASGPRQILGQADVDAVAVVGASEQLPLPGQAGKHFLLQGAGAGRHPVQNRAPQQSDAAADQSRPAPRLFGKGPDAVAVEADRAEPAGLRQKPQGDLAQPGTAFGDGEEIEQVDIEQGVAVKQQEFGGERVFRVFEGAGSAQGLIRAKTAHRGAMPGHAAEGVLDGARPIAAQQQDFPQTVPGHGIDQRIQESRLPEAQERLRGIGGRRAKGCTVMTNENDSLFKH